MFIFLIFNLTVEKLTQKEILLTLWDWISVHLSMLFSWHKTHTCNPRILEPKAGRLQVSYQSGCIATVYLKNKGNAKQRKTK